MFGKYYRQIDNKNRVVIPAKLLQELGSEFYITIGFDKSLVLRTPIEFDKIKNKLEENNSLNKDIRDLTRYIFANTELVSPDKLGRIVLAKHFCQKLAIINEVVFLGVGSTCEIFSKEIYDAKENYYEDEENIDSLAQKLFEQGVKL
ncbi:division/cell wall cluster transcriptional repressor MraZ [Metamycoplasma equirhinis]|uniref:Transcriptional regulator MraZ n=1 Tax=Metamycoplasma equirhinis TaxID=92402 RepID=A0ABZ0P9G8_9BACT|nr:division/cell wall cluster transcriptional repressor MraZ [Metamycoplasma equirhinis]TPD97816.1 division/cell wall cluster transcriptional repressor MraZ [Metamycoplasma equirhinis]WPB53673.1 division/cell wall cluster transcriptional repressor MraZ [Metamycoplasma equirhinis]BDX52682.1 transcriptional regulator MraZ [Metamycoplasma equirhinis]